MVTVTTTQRKPITEPLPPHIAVVAGHRANTLATVEYRFDEGFVIRVEDVPMRYDEQTGREYIHARISKPLHRRVKELAETVRDRAAQGFPVSNAALDLYINASELLAAA